MQAAGGGISATGGWYPATLVVSCADIERAEAGSVWAGRAAFLASGVATRYAGWSRVCPFASSEVSGPLRRAPEHLGRIASPPFPRVLQLGTSL